jgi:hypothetical protein
MEIKIDLDLPEIIGAAVSAERIQPIVNKAVTEAIKEAINDATGYRSAFREELKRQLKEAMPHGLSIDDCAKFQHMLNQAVSEAVRGENANAMKAAMLVATKSVIPDVPERIKLSDLMDDARGGFHKDDHEAFYAHLKLWDNGGGILSLDSDENCRSEYSASMRIAFNSEGAVYSLKLDGRDITPKSMPDAVGSFDGLLLSMYVGRTSLEQDIDADDVESAALPKEG